MRTLPCSTLLRCSLLARLCDRQRGCNDHACDVPSTHTVSYIHVSTYIACDESSAVSQADLNLELQAGTSGGRVGSRS